MLCVFCSICQSQTKVEDTDEDETMSSHAQKQKISFLENNLDQLTKVSQPVLSVKKKSMWKSLDSDCSAYFSSIKIPQKYQNCYLCHANALEPVLRHQN